jgi:hypothetical protein
VVDVSAVGLDELERTVGEKWAAACAARMPKWEVESLSVDWSAWFGTALLPLDQQVPPEQYVTTPRRTTWLVLVDHLLDDAEKLTEEQWLLVSMAMQYGGRTRIA